MLRSKLQKWKPLSGVDSKSSSKLVQISDSPLLPSRVEQESGPKGREANAATEVALRAGVLSYSRSRGLFAGAFLDGSTLRPDNDANQRLYNRSVTAKEIVLDGTVAPPSAAQDLLSELNERSPKNLSR